MTTTSTDRIAGISTSVAVKAPCRVATTANITLSGLQTIDGVTVVADDSVLVKNQTDAVDNGVYVASTTAWARREDFDGDRDLVKGTLIYVYAGTVGGDLFYQVTSSNPIIIDTDDIDISLSDALIGIVDLNAAVSAAEADAVAAAASASAAAASVSSAHTNRVLAVFKPYGNEPPATNYATLDTRNGHPCLDFDTTTQEAAIWSDVMPYSYGGNGITVYVHWAATSATSGTVGWTVELERVDSVQDVDSDGFASAATITAATTNATSGILTTTSVAIASGSAMDSIVAGDSYRIRIKRDVSNDNATGDAEVYKVVIREQ